MMICYGAVEVTLFVQLSKVGKWGWADSNLDFLHSRVFSKANVTVSFALNELNDTVSLNLV
eukprot:scaffold1036_cov169-Ochromonas_danica.AAC.14